MWVDVGGPCRVTTVVEVEEGRREGGRDYVDDVLPSCAMCILRL